ncbi:MAG: hypothetical protein AB1816_20685 [Bacillota bacterium]
MEVAVCEVCGRDMVRGGRCRGDVVVAVGGRWPGPERRPGCEAGLEVGRRDARRLSL